MCKNRKSYFEFLCHEYLFFQFAVFTIIFLSFYSTKVSYGMFLRILKKSYTPGNLRKCVFIEKNYWNVNKTSTKNVIDQQKDNFFGVRGLQSWKPQNERINIRDKGTQNTIFVIKPTIKNQLKNFIVIE